METPVQGELDFDASADGYANWTREQAQTLERIAEEWNLPLGSVVRVKPWNLAACRT